MTGFAVPRTDCKCFGYLLLCGLILGRSCLTRLSNFSVQSSRCPSLTDSSNSVPRWSCTRPLFAESAPSSSNVIKDHLGLIIGRFIGGSLTLESKRFLAP